MHVEIGVDYLLEDGFVGRASRRPARNACVSEDDVKFTKVLGEFSEELLTVLRNRNVSAVGERARRLSYSRKRQKGHSANNCEQVRSAQGGPSLPASFFSDRNCHSTLAAQLGLRWAANRRTGRLLFPTRTGQPSWDFYYGIVTIEATENPFFMLTSSRSA